MSKNLKIALRRFSQQYQNTNWSPTYTEYESAPPKAVDGGSGCSCGGCPNCDKAKRMKVTAPPRGI